MLYGNISTFSLEGNMNTVSLGEFLKEARKRRNLTQMEIARIIKVASATISRWEGDTMKPPLEQVDLIVQGYQLVEKEKEELLEFIKSVKNKKSRFFTEVKVLYGLLSLPKEARERIIKIATAYDVQKENE